MMTLELTSVISHWCSGEVTSQSFVYNDYSRGLSIQYANCNRSSVVGIVEVMNILVSLLKHFIMTDMRAMGL